MTLERDDKKRSAHRRTEIAMWANEHALVSGVVILIGGIVGLFNFSGWQFAGYAVFIGCVIIIYEYPRGLREDGVCIRRRGQDIIEPLVSVISQICCNSYGVRAAFYLVLSLPCVGCLPSLMGGVSLLIASLLYFISALRQETRKSPGVLQPKYKWKKKSTIKRPKHPPPRLKHYNAGASPSLTNRSGSKLAKPSIILTIPSDTSENSGSQVGSIEDTSYFQNNLEETRATVIDGIANQGFHLEVKHETVETRHVIDDNHLDCIINDGFAIDTKRETNTSIGNKPVEGRKEVKQETGSNDNPVGGVINHGFKMEVQQGTESIDRKPMVDITNQSCHNMEVKQRTDTNIDHVDGEKKSVF